MTQNLVCVVQFRCPSMTSSNYADVNLVYKQLAQTDRKASKDTGRFIDTNYSLHIGFSLFLL